MRLLDNTILHIFVVYGLAIHCTSGKLTFQFAQTGKAYPARPPRTKLALLGMAPAGTVLLGDAAVSLRPPLLSLAAIFSTIATPRLGFRLGEEWKGTVDTSKWRISG